MELFYEEKEIELPIYHGTIVFIDSNDIGKINERHKLDAKREPFASAYENYKKLDDGSTQTYYLIVCNSKTKLDFTVGSVAHECFHITNFIFENRGIKADLNNDEPQAYLLEYLMDIAYGFYFAKKTTEAFAHALSE
ncbi:hypothetical protein SAMN04489761_4303 [Tenacibaculum sp. MAR_2009_124]|uniref:hypothetical protein n=1 Tax=Tenacibaculum sp. MAR_2009_124 TaxID=1250059 RepID=UPI00089C6ACC|nr:hypothetical protein [Tenacibaculum sp. MAR_2009_124]SED10958.1 hypothetical protein SAMN04489761_4303 [Tenacibaculum sp. MAR_2009_124]